MFVYGIRCSPQELKSIPQNVNADYYMDYGILVFPSYTRPTVIHAHGRPNLSYWRLVKPMIEEPTKVHVTDLIEHPFITEEEAGVLDALRPERPNIQTDWFYVPAVAAPTTHA
jgi:hypothetical protein